jgi:hypothetical protein
MPKSEQIGEINDIEVSQINEKLRIIQQLFDGIFGTFGEKFLSIKTGLSDVVDSGSTDATEQSWIEVTDADGNTGYIRIYGSK